MKNYVTWICQIKQFVIIIIIIIIIIIMTSYDVVVSACSSNISFVYSTNLLKILLFKIQLLYHLITEDE